MRRPNFSALFPFFVGIIASPIVFWIADYAWREWKGYSMLFSVGYFVSFGLGVFWRTPVRKAISTALLIGVGMPILIFLSKYFSF